MDKGIPFRSHAESG